MRTKTEMKISPYVRTLFCGNKLYHYYSLPKLAEEKKVNLNSMPYSIRILLENCLRRADGSQSSQQQIMALANWQSIDQQHPTVAYMPARILMQDFTGLPVLNDLSALRAALQRQRKSPQKINPRIPVDLVIDHSVSVEAYGCPEAQSINEEKEFKQNFERYQFLKWSQSAFSNLRVIPPGSGICHQINLEYLAKVVFFRDEEGESLLYPDSVLGTDSHTTMINGLGVAGWGVGGIEALAAMLGYPSEFPLPDVVGLELKGELPERATATDLTLTITSRLRKLGVVGKFVELFGTGYAELSLEMRAMIANMSPESGATMTYCPVDNVTLEYLQRSGRTAEQIELIETYFQAQSLFLKQINAVPQYSQILSIDLGEIEPCLAGPKRPQDTLLLVNASECFQKSLRDSPAEGGFGLSTQDAQKAVELKTRSGDFPLGHGSVIIAAITSCTNTSDPSVMITAGLLARNAVRKGLRSRPWVKTSFAPGSRVVSAYLEKSGLMQSLQALGFHVVGYGCTTCIGNSGPLAPEIIQAVQKNDLVAAAVLSGNRNFEGRIHPAARASYLASPPLVLAYALAGSLHFNFDTQPLGHDPEGQPIFLKDIYPSREEIAACSQQAVISAIFQHNYEQMMHSNARWNDLQVPSEQVFEWDASSNLIREPAFLLEDRQNGSGIGAIREAYVLAVLGDSITTDHISPAGRIAPDLPAGQYLLQQGVAEEDFISFGARRGNHEVMLRGTFSNPRLQNRLAQGQVGGFTRHIPSGEILSIFEAAQRYRQDEHSVVILAGKAYGSGSSRDWAAKGTYLLGVRAVIAESFERIHRTNLVCMGVLPLQFLPGQNAQTLNLCGDERYTIVFGEKNNQLKPHLQVSVHRPDNSRTQFEVIARIDTPLELDYFQAGGLMRKVAADL